MARYDVYRDPRGTDNLLVSIQSDVFDALDTRMAIPLLPERADRTALKKLNPIIDIAGKRYALYTQLMLAVPVSALREKVTNISGSRDEITAALDMLFQGF
ncbi:CcdB family protein [Aliihoeflea sp. PC F10.4]